MRRVREETQWQSVCLEKKCSLFILQDRRSVTSVYVSQRVYSLVVTAEECRRATDAAGCCDNGAIHVEQQTRHSLGIFFVLPKDRRTLFAEQILRRSRNMQRGFTFSGYVEHYK